MCLNKAYKVMSDVEKIPFSGYHEYKNKNLTLKVFRRQDGLYGIKQNEDPPLEGIKIEKIEQFFSNFFQNENRTLYPNGHFNKYCKTTNFDIIVRD